MLLDHYYFMFICIIIIIINYIEKHYHFGLIVAEHTQVLTHILRDAISTIRYCCPQINAFGEIHHFNSNPWNCIWSVLGKFNNIYTNSDQPFISTINNFIPVERGNFKEILVSPLIFNNYAYNLLIIMVNNKKSNQGFWGPNANDLNVQLQFADDRHCCS